MTQTLRPASGPGMLTWSGRFVPAVSTQDHWREDIEVPSMIDIAVSLSRMPRFGGHCSRWWSVLDHVMFVETLARTYPWPVPRMLRLAALLHDAHEAITGDIPTHFKTNDMRFDQRVIDRWIMGSHFPGGLLTFESCKEPLRELDQRALLAEALELGPYRAHEYAEMEHFFGARPNPDDVNMLELFWTQRKYDIDAGAQASNVKTFLNLVHELR